MLILIRLWIRLLFIQLKWTLLRWVRAELTKILRNEELIYWIFIRNKIILIKYVEKSKKLILDYKSKLILIIEVS